MGKAEKANPMSDKNIGKFNVRIILQWNMDRDNEILDVDSWDHIGPYLALSLDRNHLRIINLRHVLSFDVLPQPEELDA